MKRNYWSLLIFIFLGVTGLFPAHAVNTCIEHTVADSWQCLTNGYFTNSGSLSTNTLYFHTCDTLTAPTLTTIPGIVSGQITRTIYTTCPTPASRTETNSLRYLVGPLQFSPAISGSFSYPTTTTYTAYVVATPTPLVGWWPGESNRIDLIYSNNFAFASGADYASAEVGHGFTLSGSGSYIAGGDTTYVSVGSNNNFSVEAWIKALPTTNYNGQDCIFDTGAYALYLQNGRLGCRLGCSGGSLYTNATTSAVLTNGQLHHIAFSYTCGSANGGKLYVDGTNVLTFDTRPASGSFYRGGIACVGNNVSLGGNAYRGIIDDLSVYRCSLGSNDVQAIYSAGPSGKCWPNSPSGCFPLPSSCVCGPVTQTVATVTIHVTPWPSITAQPTNLTLVQGEDATFNVTADPAGGPFSYQWKFNGTSITGATGSSYTKIVILPEDAGNYSVLVQNATCSTLSSTGTLSVVVPLTITGQPQGGTVIQGTNFSFNVGVSGTSPVYQWWSNNVGTLANGGQISGATSATLILTSVTTANDGNYSAVITNLAGSVISANAALSVIPPPIIVAPLLTNQTIVQAKDVTFAVSATGATYYQWQFNSVDIPGANGSSFTKLVVQTSDAGSYSVIATNLAGSTNASAVLTVIVPPLITQQPTNVFVGAGNNASNGIVVAGDSPFVYQWYFNDTSVISWETNISIVFTNAQATDAGDYSILVTNLAGTNLSIDAALIVTNCSGCSGTPPTVPTTVPNVSMTLPTTPVTNPVVYRYGDPIALRATATAGSRRTYITNVVFYGGSNATTTNTIGTAVIGANTEYAFRFTSAPLGTNWVAAVATDNAGRTNMSSKVYFIMNTNPVITMAANTNIIWEGVATNVWLASAVTDDGYPYHLTNVLLSASGGNGNVTWSQIVSNTSPSTIFVGMLATFTNYGTYQISLQADDGYVTNTGMCNVKVMHRPVVSITAPTNLSHFFPGTPIALNAVASDPDGTIASVKFYDHTTLLGTGLRSATNLYAYGWYGATMGTHIINAVATDNDGLTSTASIALTVVNQGPNVNAGIDRSVSLPQTTALTINGSVYDPDNAPVTPLYISWSKIAGPGSVLFSSVGGSNPAAIGAWFASAGDYTLRLYASDSRLSSFDDMVVHVTASNTGPYVSAGPDQTITYPDLVYLPGTCSDDGLPLSGTLTVTWSKDSDSGAGTGTIAFDDPHSATTMASFSSPGTYVLRLTADDGSVTNFLKATITVNEFAGTEIFTNVDIASSGIAGLRESDKGIINLQGVSGTVHKAYLYWHGPTVSQDMMVNAAVLVNGRLVTGRNIGASTDDNWDCVNSQAYRADVTALVSILGNGNYLLENFTKARDILVNGASLVVFFDKPGSTEKRDVMLSQGNDGNGGFNVSADGSVLTLASDYTGKVYAGGDFSTLGGFDSSTFRSRIGRLQSDGTADYAFDPGDGVNSGGEVRSVILQGEGNIIISGDFTSVDGVDSRCISKIDAVGNVNTNFCTQIGSGPDAPINDAVLDSNGKTLIVGEFTHFGGTAFGRIARLNVDGTLDTSFTPGSGANDTIKSVRLDANSNILVAGEFTTFNGTNRGRIARLNANGGLDLTFEPPGTGADNTVYKVALDGNEKVLIAGAFTTIDTTTRNRIARLNADGSLDTSFDSGDGPDDVVETLCIQSGTKVILGGRFLHVDGHLCNHFARLNSGGAFDSSFGSENGFIINGTSTGASVNAILTESTGRILVGGLFDKYDGVPQLSLARLTSEGQLVRSPHDAEWYVEFSGIHYTSGPASIELHVSDGQPYGDEWHHRADLTVKLNGLEWWAPEEVATCSSPADLQLFAGNSISAANTDCQLWLWDIKEKSIASFLSSSAGPQSVLMSSTNSGDDYLSLIVALAKLPVGSLVSGVPPMLPPLTLSPIVRTDTMAVHHGTRVQLIDVLNNDTCPSGGLLAVASVGSPAHGHAEIVYKNSAVLYIPDPGFIGTDSFTYTAMDAIGNTGSATVMVTVDGPEAIPLECNVARSGNLGASGATTTVLGVGQPADFYSFFSKGGGFVTVTLSTTPFTGHVYLRNPLGFLIAGDGYSNFPLQMDGIYTIEFTCSNRRDSGNYSITADYGCSPKENIQVWTEGIQVPDGGTIEVGTDFSKIVVITNAGNATFDPGTRVSVNCDSNKFTMNPHDDGDLGNFMFTPLPPNGGQNLLIKVTDTNTAGSVTSLFKFYPSGFDGTLIGYVNPAGTPPTVSITTPASNSVFRIPVNVPLLASAAASSGSIITNVEFFALSFAGKVKIAESQTSPYSSVWFNVPVGHFKITARASDSAGRRTDSAPVPVTITKPGPNHPPVATDDHLNVFINSVSNILDVLSNDYDEDGDSLTIASASTQYGAVTIGAGGKAILYNPLANSYGQDIINYSITDGHNGRASAKAYVSTIQTTVQITAPTEGTVYATNTPFTITANADTSDGAIAQVEFYANNNKIGEDWIPPYSISWFSASPGRYELTALALDTRGFTVRSGPVRVRIGTGSDQPIAEIANLTDGQVIREGGYDLIGSASNLNSSITATYQVSLYRPDDGVATLEERWVADLTQPVNANKLNQLLGHLDFSAIQNGAYTLTLKVDGDVESLSQDVRLIVESNLKIGQFTFSEQDLVVPVSGIPLTVTRTYNSINPVVGDFGASWTYALNDVDLQIDEDRGTSDDPTADPFNIRLGGGRDVSLTLPDGRRTTFSFDYKQGQCNDGDVADFCYYATWTPPYGINAKLTAVDDNRLLCLWGGFEHWLAYPDAGIDNFDFSGFVLETADGTQYTIQRQSLGTHNYLVDGEAHSVHSYGKAKLTSIRTRNHDLITISPTSVLHYLGGTTLTRSLLIERTNDNLISAIRDPRTTTGWPVLRYVYDSSKNLSGVWKLIKPTEAYDTNAYAITTYHYTNVTYPHFLTSIDDPRGVKVARSKYDEAGRLIEMTDALGNTTRFEHDLDNRRETITDPLGHKTVHTYDERGNVVSTIDPLGHLTSRIYDLNNNVLSEIDALGQATSYTYDDRGLRLTTGDPMGHTNSVTYNANCQPTSATDALGRVTTNFYDARGNLTSTVQTLGGRSITTSSEFDATTGQITATVDPLGNRTEFAYGAVNLVTTTTKDPSGTVLTVTTYAEPGGLTGGYDASGNRVVEFTTRTLPTSTTETNVTRYVYDQLNRVTKTVLPLNTNGFDTYTTQTTYDLNGKSLTTTDMLGRVTSYFYDARGNVVQTQYPDGNISRTIYDALGRAVISSDRTNAPTSPNTQITVNGHRTAYDSAGRAIRSDRLKDITIDMVASTSTNFGVVTTLYSTVLLDPPPVVFSATTTEYDEAGRVLSSKDELGAKTSYEYDTAGRRISTIDDFGAVTTFAYDANGNQILVVDALMHTNTYTYDELNRRTIVSYPKVAGESSNPSQTTVYDDSGRRIAEVDMGGVTTGFCYDSLGRLIAVTNAFNTTDQTVTTYAYDEMGNQTSQTDAEGRVTKFEYDKMGRRRKRTLPGTSSPSETTSYGIVVSGAVNVLCKKVTDFNGNSVCYVNDSMDRLERKVVGTDWTASPAVTYTYLPSGLRETMVDGLGTTTYAYDESNHLIEKDVPQGPWYYVRDVKGNLIAMNFQSDIGYWTSYSWDRLNRLSAVRGTEQTTPTITSRYHYDIVGNLQSVTTERLFGMQSISAYAYDARNRLTSMAVTNAADVGEERQTNRISFFDYNPVSRPLDVTGLRRSVRETNYFGTTVDRAVNYYYDNLYRLTKEDITRGSPSGTIDYGTNTGYFGYDKVGNRRSRKVTGSGLVSAGVTDFGSQGFDDRDRLTGTGNSFDENGNTLRGAVNPAQTNIDDAYDYENRLTARHTISATIYLTYDGDGNRVRKDIVSGGTTNSTISYLVDDQNPTGYPQVVAEMTPIAGVMHPTRLYLHGTSLIAEQLVDPDTNARTPYFYGLDGHGNVRLLLDGSGSVTDTYTYDGFGILIASTPSSSPTPNNYLYCGEQFDSDLGLYFNRARYLNVGTGRFWTMDAFQGNAQEPLSLHKYTYGGNNPIMMMDPSGYLVEDVAAATALGTSLDTLAISTLVSAYVTYVVYSGAKSIYDDYQIRSVAKDLNVEVEPAANLCDLQNDTDWGRSERKREKGWKYFAHGTSTGAWKGSSILASGGGDFGTGFYTFESNLKGLFWAGGRATKTSSQFGGLPFILVVKIKQEDLNGMMSTALDLRDNSSQWTSTVTTFLNNNGQGISGRPIVIGPVSVQGRGLLRGDTPTQKAGVPNQWKWENVTKLKPAAVIPVFNGFNTKLAW
jgi:RHS repeat-associated protein/uncharacterized delta-60 repeat protein